jgi:hypothetical protein
MNTEKSATASEYVPSYDTLHLFLGLLIHGCEHSRVGLESGNYLQSLNPIVVLG